MSNELIVAIIALAGVLFSAVISFIVSRREAKLQLSEQLHKYSSELFLKRMDAYPELYVILSRFAKAARKGKLTSKNVQDTLVQLDEWDSKHILLLSQPVVLNLMTIETKLEKWSKLKESEINSPSVADSIIREVIQLEKALKIELGVFSLTDFQNTSLQSS